MKSIGLSLAALCLAAPSAFAADLKVPSVIDAVTVFPLGAAVSRVAPVSLPAGATTVILDDLPATIDPQSITVEGSGDHPIAIASVESRALPAGGESDPARVALAAAIEALTDRIAAIDDRIAALDGRRRFLEQLIDATPEGFAKALAEGKGAVETWSAAATTIGDGLAAAAEATRAAEVEKRGLGRDLEAREKALAELSAPVGHTGVRIALAADTATEGRLTVRYRVADARWAAAYDATLTTGEGGVEPELRLVRRAEVTQATGEDWGGVDLTLSTVRTAEGTAVPQLQPNLITFYENRPVPAEQRAMDTAAPAAPLAGKVGDLADGGEADEPAVSATHIEAAADFGDFRAAYRVPGRVSVESGVGARAVQIATETLTPSLEVRAAPALAETAYLDASFVPPAGAPMLAGNVALFRDGSFVGNGSVPFTEAGARVDLGFGVDDRVKVQRVALDRDLGEHGIFASRKTDERRFKITVANLHDRPIDVVVTDSVPYAEDQQVSVQRLTETTAPTVVDVDDRRGVLAWRYTYQAGESRDIFNAYVVSWPADREVVWLEPTL